MYVPESVVKPMFENFGVLDSFQFEERRGIGRVTFADGDAAEQCYLTLQYTSLDALSLPGLTGTSMSSSTPKVLYLEFAEYLPFVNRWLLRGDLLRGGASNSRQMLRTFPRRRDFGNAKSGERETQLGVLLGLSSDEAPQQEADFLSAALAGRSGSPMADAFFSVQLPTSVNLALPFSQRAATMKALHLKSFVSCMDLWHSYFVYFIVGSPLSVAPPSLYQGVVQGLAGDPGLYHMIDPFELPYNVIHGHPDVFFADVAAAVGVRRVGKNGEPMEKKIAVRRLFAAAGRAAHIGFEGQRPSSVSSDELRRAEDVGAALQWTAAYLTTKCFASLEPGRAAVLAAFAPLVAVDGPRDAAAVEALWGTDAVTSIMRQAIAPTTAAQELFTRGGVLSMSLSVLYRSGSLGGVGPAVRLVDAHASSGSGEALLPLCAPVSPTEVRERGAEAKRPYKRVRLAFGALWWLMRVPLTCIAIIALIATFVSLAVA